MKLDNLRAEIERMGAQMCRQRKEMGVILPMDTFLRRRQTSRDFVGKSDYGYAAGNRRIQTAPRSFFRLLIIGSQRVSNGWIAANRVLFLAYVISGVIASIAGIFYAARNDSAGSDTGLGWEVTALAAVVLGGARLSGGSGTIPRVLIGSSIAFLLVSGLLRMNAPGSLTSGLVGLVLLSAVGLSTKLAEARKLSGR
jgi:hypothetical protein